MVYKILADAVVLIHFLWILFLVFGAIPGVRRRIIKMFHIAGLAYALVIQTVEWYCPLTHLEVWLKSKYAAGPTYGEPFVVHYIEELVYLDVSRNLIAAFTLVICLVNGWIYFGRK